MLQMLYRVERILKGFGHILLNILSARTRIHRDDHNRVGIDVGVEVDREFGKREKAENYHSHEAERGHDGAFHGRTV